MVHFSPRLDPGVVGIRLGPMLRSEGHSQIHGARVLPGREDQVLNGHRGGVGKWGIPNGPMGKDQSGYNGIL